MKLIKNLVRIKLNENEIMYVNTLNGLVDVLTVEEEKLVQEIDEKHLDQNKYKFLLKLKERGYFLDEEEENQKKKELFQFLKKLNANRMDKVRSIGLVLTYQCNFKCEYCYEKERVRHADRVMTKDMVNYIFDSHSDVSDITLFGGEPLLLSNREIIQYIIYKFPKKHYSIVTNGYFLEEYLDIISEIDISNIQVTLDGTKDFHNKRRILKNGKGTFEKILFGLGKCLDRGIPITIRMNVDEKNLPGSFMLKKELQSKFKEHSNILQFEISPLMNLSPDQKYKVNRILMKNELKDDLERQVAASSSPIIKLLYGNKMNPKYYSCNHAHTRFYDCFGDIYTCILAVGIPELTVGKFYPEYQLKEDSMLKRTIFNINKCKNCEKAVICGGGCPYENYLLGKNIMEANCMNIINDVTNIIPKLYNNKYH